jgi:uncharacterized protein (DUF433 family)
VSLPERIEPPPLRTGADGVVRVGGTRVTLDSILHAHRRGDTPEEIAEGFPTVPLADIYAVIAYYLHYREEVDAYLAEQEAAGERVRREVEERFPATELREKVRRLREQS